MARRRRRTVSFDAMVRFFMQHYNIPTKKDIGKLKARMDQLEELIKITVAPGKRSHVSRVNSAKRKTPFVD